MAATVIGTSGIGRGHRREPLGRRDQPHQVQPLRPRRAQRRERRDAGSAGRDHHLQQHHLVGCEVVGQALQVGVRLEGALVPREAHEAHPRPGGQQVERRLQQHEAGAEHRDQGQAAGRAGDAGGRHRGGHLPVHGLEVAEGLGHGEGAEDARRPPHGRVGRPRVADRRQVGSHDGAGQDGGRAGGHGGSLPAGRKRTTAGPGERWGVPHAERHLSHREGWLRAAVLGANDGTLSTAGLVVGVAASDASLSAILTAGFAGLVGRRALDGGRRVRVGELTARRRARRPTARAARARGGPGGRAGRAGRDLRGPRPEPAARPPGGRGAVGGRPARRPRSRRAGPRPARHGPALPGRVDVGGLVRRGRGPAAGGDRGGPGRGPRSP